MARVGSKNELVKCEYCGEMYSVTYKHCPFCNEDGTGRWDDLENGTDFDLDEDGYEDIPQNKGGKRLAGGRRGGGGGGYRGPSIGRIITTVLSLALIIAAVCIVVSIVKSMLGEDPKKPVSTPSPAVTESVQPQETPAPAESQEPDVPDVSAPVIPAPGESAPAIPTPAPGHAVGTPTSFTLNREDFTFDGPGQIFEMKAKFLPEGTSGTVTWKSSDPNVASVSWNGVVTSVSKGTVTLTATVDGVGEQKCIVRCSFKDGTGAPAASTPPSNTSDPSSTSTPSAGFTLNREDFTLKKDETFRLVVKGTSAGASWSSSDAKVATVSADGTVTGIGKGTCKVTATINGQSVKCIVRCSG